MNTFVQEKKRQTLLVTFHFTIFLCGNEHPLHLNFYGTDAWYLGIGIGTQWYQLSVPVCVCVSINVNLFNNTISCFILLNIDFSIYKLNQTCQNI